MEKPTSESMHLLYVFFMTLYINKLDFSKREINFNHYRKRKKKERKNIMVFKLQS